MSGKNYATFLIPILVFFSCNVENKRVETAVKSISAEDMKKNISVLASDDFRGRAPSTIGEDKTINYLAGQFKEIGLKPADNGSYFQWFDHPYTVVNDHRS